MYYFAVGFGAWLHVFFWGAGLAMWSMPRPWARFWPVLACPAGLALQSLVVWLGAYAGFAGTDVYAWWAEALPLVLLVAGGRRRGGRAAREIGRFAGLWLLMAANLAVLLTPLARAARGLNTLSLGSFDAADYAAGARVLKEFAHADRAGFLGLTEVVRVGSVDNFFDFWLRLNHFTPSALIALNGTVLDCAPHELTSVLTIVVLVCSLPVVFWCARTLLGYRALAAAWVAGLYGFSAVTWYAVFHVAIGQLLAAPAIALITWAGVALWRGQLTVRRVTAFAGVLAVAYALIWGSYNFIVVVCLVPAVALAGGVAWWRREWSRFAGWSVAMLAPLAACGVVFWTRVDGLAERFLLFRATDFGWRVPVLTSEGWLGWVGDYQLNALAGSARWIVFALFSGAFVATVAWAWRRRRDVGYVAVCLTIPPLMGYAFLQVRGAVLGTNASYDAYKILAVFFPGILAAAAWPVARGLQARGVMRTGAVALLGLITIGHVRAVGLYFERMKLAPFGVTRELVQLRRLEQQPEISSVNMLIADGWSRLWANAHLLRIPQFFDTHTYEGRLNTPLRGRWDLVGGVLDLSLPDAGSRRLGPHYSLLDTKSPWFLRARFGAGWFDLEQLVSSPEQWRWSRREGSVRLENPQPYSLRADLELRARAIAPTTLEVWINGVLWTTVKVGIAPAEMRVSGLALPPGESVVVFRTATGTNSTEADPRELGCAFYRIGFHVTAHSAGVR